VEHSADGEATELETLTNRKVDSSILLCSATLWMVNQCGAGYAESVRCRKRHRDRALNHPFCFISGSSNGRTPRFSVL